MSGGVGQPAPSVWMILLLSAAAGAALGLILGAAQGMPLILFAAGIPAPHTSALAIGALVLVTVGVTGVVVGATEGAFLRLLLRTAG